MWFHPRVAKRTKRSKITTPTVLTFAEADAQLAGSLSAAFQGGYRSVAYFPGDVSIKGDFLAGIAKLVTGEYSVIAIEGDLKVDGRIRLYDSRPGLYVGGSTTAETLEGGDCEAYLQDGRFTYFVYGYYNDGTLETSTVDTPWVINSNHDLRVDAPNAKTIDNYGDDDDADFGEANIATSFVAAVRDGDEIDVEKFYKRLKARKPVLVAGAKTNKELALAEVKGAKTGKRPELVIKTTKLKAFPSDALKMKQLVKLVLDGNEIGKVPDAIGTLTALEELSLSHCDLAELPASIGKLTNLRVLRIAGNRHTDYARTKTVTRPIKLPAAIGNLANLEELDVSELSETVDGDRRTLPELTTFELPAGAAKWKKLRVLRANFTSLILPRGMWGLPSVEEVELRGASWCFLTALPAWVTSFPNLKRLDLSGNFFKTLPDLGKLARLEELDLGNALPLLKRVPELGKLTRLRVLNVSGNSGHTGVKEPGHDVLRPLFAMTLPSLVDLRIDRWGGGARDSKGRGDLAPATLAGIGRFTALEKLDLEFNGLAKLPAELFTLPALKELKLGYNRLGKADLAKVKKTWPKATIEIGIQH